MVDDLMSDREKEIRDHPMPEAWFRQRSKTACEFMGHEPGSQSFEECRHEKINSFLDSPVSAAATRPHSVAMSAISLFKDNY